MRRGVSWDQLGSEGAITCSIRPKGKEGDLDKEDQEQAEVEAGDLGGGIEGVDPRQGKEREKGQDDQEEGEEDLR